MLLGLLPTALAVEGWAPACAAKNDPTIWFVLSQAANVAPLPDYECKGLFFETLACSQTVAMGKIAASGVSPGGYPLYELRYLPSGNAQIILSFLSQPGGGVAYKVPVVTGPTPASTPAPPTPAELFSQYLLQRNKASAATNGITVHVWTCPEAPFTAPKDAIDPFGMTLQTHTGRTSLY